MGAALVQRPKKVLEKLKDFFKHIFNRSFTLSEMSASLIWFTQSSDEQKILVQSQIMRYVNYYKKTVFATCKNVKSKSTRNRKTQKLQDKQKQKLQKKQNLQKRDYNNQIQIEQNLKIENIQTRSTIRKKLELEIIIKIRTDKLEKLRLDIIEKNVKKSRKTRTK